MDSLAPTRGGSEDPLARRLLTELLMQMSGLAAEGSGGGGGPPVYVFAATNRIQVGLLKVAGAVYAQVHALSPCRAHIC